MEKRVENLWDQRFSNAGDQFLYGIRPNQWIFDRLPRLPRGAKVLALADGEGRNAVWLGQQGYQVSNWDYSRVGLDKTQVLAEQYGASVECCCVDLRCCDWPKSSFDAIVSSFFHLPKSDQLEVWQNVAEALSLGGHLVVQVFAEAQLGNSSGGPKDKDLLYRLEDLQSALASLTMLHAEEADVVLDEGHLHQGMARVINIHAIKQG